MSGPASPPPLRVEQALRLLPDVDALAPLRAFLISNSRPGEEPAWAPGEPYRTVGKRTLQPADLRDRVPQAIGRVTDHLTVLYDAVVAALESEQRGDLAAAVRALLRAGEREEGVGRYAQARIWYEHALGLSEQLRDRRPEIEALRVLGHLQVVRGGYEEGARYFQRGFVLADAEMDREGAILACQGLGDVALVQGQWAGAESWYTRGLTLAEGDRLHTGQLLHSLGNVARRRGDLDAAAERYQQARRIFAELGAAAETPRVLTSQGLLEAQRGRPAEARAAYADALASLKLAGGDPSLEMAIRLNLSEVHLQAGRLREAEDALRRAEELAIAHNLTRQLARLYVVMGRLRGREDDEEGFVFFEKALELCRGLESAARVEGQVYHEYGLFRSRIGEREEARAYLERAQEIFETLGDAPALQQVREALQQLAY